MQANRSFEQWAAGYGVIRHSERTRQRIWELVGLMGVSPGQLFELLAALDRVTAMGCWLVGHMTYARHIRLDGQPLGDQDFKLDPQGHTGGSLNMVPAYAAYLAANALSGHTRGWMMGQGHCVTAIDAVNVIVRNLTPTHESRYPWNAEGLTRLTQDFYDYRVQPTGHPASPLGSHVNAHTAGGILEGGYLGFADLHYVHTPLPGERLVAFLSDGAFEEQRGADWAPRWWRAEDCGSVVPVMIANGRRIEQRSTIAQMGGVDWLAAHLRNHSFYPIVIDGTDPAEFLWAICVAEHRLAVAAGAIRTGQASYPVALPYVIAEAPKGFGFPHSGTNAAHGTPLAANPATSANARDEFNAAAARLWVPAVELEAACLLLNTHEQQHRCRERDNPMAHRHPPKPVLPEPAWAATGSQLSPMRAADTWLTRCYAANPALRVRVGNPDELQSNQLPELLASLRHRVTIPEPGNHEAIDGAIITALNEEAVVCAALANKGGINLVVSYEAFAVKMLGALRQEIIFSRHQRECGNAPGWLSVPVIATSHTWENGKNEQSHQDPALSEVLLGEMADVCRVLFVADANGAQAALRSVYAERGRIALLVIPKLARPVVLDAAQAEALARDGGLVLLDDANADLELVAVGAYQLEQALLAHERLHARGVPSRLVYLQEPGRFRQPRDRHEASVAGDAGRRLFPGSARARILITHTRPELLAGILATLPPAAIRSVGYANQGGTLDTGGLMFANRCTWAHLVSHAADLLGLPAKALLSAEEQAAVDGHGDPYLLIPRPHSTPLASGATP